MDKWEKIRKERHDRADKYDRQLRDAIKVIQGLLWVSVVEKLVDFAYSPSGNFLFSASNIGKTESVALAIAVETSRQRPGFIRTIIRNILQMIGVNKRYFRTIQRYDAAQIDAEVRKLVLRRFGYNITNDRLIRGGWLDVVTRTDEIGKRVAMEINQAIASKMSQKEFIEQLRPLFLGQDGLGFVEYQYQQLTHDLYMQTDRQTQVLYASQLKLRHALYAGTAKDNTRPFCLQRIDQVYTVDEIAKWENLEFQGKLKVGYNPFVHCGGYNCRHSLSFISAEMVEAMGYDVNEYNKGIVLA